MVSVHPHSKRQVVLSPNFRRILSSAIIEASLDDTKPSTQSSLGRNQTTFHDTSPSQNDHLHTQTSLNDSNISERNQTTLHNTNSTRNEHSNIQKSHNDTKLFGENVLSGVQETVNNALPSSENSFSSGQAFLDDTKFKKGLNDEWTLNVPIESFIVFFQNVTIPVENSDMSEFHSYLDERLRSFVIPPMSQADPGPFPRLNVSFDTDIGSQSIVSSSLRMEGNSVMLPTLQVEFQKELTFHLPIRSFRTPSVVTNLVPKPRVLDEALTSLLANPLHLKTIKQKLISTERMFSQLSEVTFLSPKPLLDVKPPFYESYAFIGILCSVALGISLLLIPVAWLSLQRYNRLRKIVESKKGSFDKKTSGPKGRRKGKFDSNGLKARPNDRARTLQRKKQRQQYHDPFSESDTPTPYLQRNSLFMEGEKQERQDQLNEQGEINEANQADDKSEATTLEIVKSETSPTVESAWIDPSKKGIGSDGKGKASDMTVSVYEYCGPLPVKRNKESQQRDLIDETLSMLEDRLAGQACHLNGEIPGVADRAYRHFVTALPEQTISQYNSVKKWALKNIAVPVDKNSGLNQVSSSRYESYSRRTDDEEHDYMHLHRSTSSRSRQRK